MAARQEGTPRRAPAGPRRPPAGAPSGPGRASASRILAHRVLVRVMADGAYAERALAHALENSGLEARDRALACELVYGTLREAPHLGLVLAPLLRQPEITLPVPVRAALRLGAHQILHTRVATYGAVDQSVALVRGFGALRGVVNAVLRRLGRARPADVAEKGDPTPAARGAAAASAGAGAGAPAAPPAGVDPRLLAELAAQRPPAAVAAWLEANRRAPPVCLRVNRRRAAPSAARARLADAGRRVALPDERPEGALDPCLLLRGGGRVQALPGWRDGWLSVQDTAATWVGSLLPPPAARPVVLDMCAAPGGKLLHLLESWGDDVRALACDLHPGRLGLLAAAAARLGLTPPATAALDARRPADLRHALAAAGLPAPGTIILDAPCSGLGTLRRHPERLARLPEPGPLVALQRALLDAAAAVLAPGGVLLYAVCTITRAEGPWQVSEFLGRHPDFVALPPPPGLAFARDGDAFRTWTDLHGTDSFFAQVLRRDAAA